MTRGRSSGALVFQADKAIFCSDTPNGYRSAEKGAKTRRKRWDTENKQRNKNGRAEKNFLRHRS
jgi:hypothetical protein